jgi:hypothetical protein
LKGTPLHIIAVEPSNIDFVEKKDAVAAVDDFDGLSGDDGRILHLEGAIGGIACFQFSTTKGHRFDYTIQDLVRFLIAGNDHIGIVAIVHKEIVIGSGTFDRFVRIFVAVLLYNMRN